ncbi:MAG: tetratricopeptide repeat protein [Phycisphaeraceae bacterium]|nr:tetratricopeptide repeat protein [Phycisphaeraceae bacterium]
MNNLTMLLKTQGKSEEAESMLRELVGMCEATLPAGHYYTAIFANNYADLLVVLGRLDEAEPLLVDSLRIIVATLGNDHVRAERGRERLTRLHRLRSNQRAENE